MGRETASSNAPGDGGLDVALDRVGPIPIDAAFTCAPGDEGSLRT